MVVMPLVRLKRRLFECQGFKDAYRNCMQWAADVRAWISGYSEVSNVYLESRHVEEVTEGGKNWVKEIA